VLVDSWFGSVVNFDFIVKKKKHFIAALKDNRLVALSEEGKRQGRFVRIDALELSDKQAVRGWLKGYANAVLLVRQVFTNKDEGTGLLNLVCSDLKCDGEKTTSLYKKRWKVEVFHKSLKSNAALPRSPTRRVAAFRFRANVVRTMPMQRTNLPPIWVSAPNTCSTRARGRGNATITPLLRRRNRFPGSAFSLNMRTPTRLFQIGFALSAGLAPVCIHVPTGIAGVGQGFKDGGVGVRQRHP
jgi:hypothetical protein